MPVLDDSRQEAFAQALASGDSVRMAGIAAGYRDSVTRCGRRADLPAIRARLEELALDAEWGGDKGLADIYAKLIAQAEEAGKLPSAAGKIATWRLLAEAARVKVMGRLAAAPPTAGTVGAGVRPFLPPILPKEEWLAAFAPKS